MSYLMVFFLILFTFSIKKTTQKDKTEVEDSLASIQKQFGGTVSNERLERLQRKKQEEGISEKVKTLIEERGLKDVVTVETTSERVKIIFKAPVLFDPGSAEIKYASAKMMFGVVSGLESLKGRQVVIEGHTDNVPIAGGRYATNWDLSGARANSVVQLLVQWGFNPAHLTSSGYGEYRPIAPNDTPEHKARNRRIEISIIRS